MTGRTSFSRTYTTGRSVAISAGLVLVLSASTAIAQSNATPSTLAPPPAGLTLVLPQAASQTPSAPAFTIGFLSGTAPDFERQRLAAFVRHVEGTLNRRVELIPMREARGLMGGLEGGSLSYAILPGALVSATAALCACIEPLASQPNGDGSLGLHAVLISAADGAFVTLSDLEKLGAARLAIVGQGSVVAHHIGLSELSRAGVRLPADEQIVFTESLAQAASMLAEGEVEAILGWSRQAQGSLLMDGEPEAGLSAQMRQNLRIVWRSRAVPGATHVVRSDVPDDDRALLRSMLGALESTNGDAFDSVDSGSGRGLVSVTLDDFAPYDAALAYWRQAASRP